MADDNAVIRFASTVVVLRDAAQGLEVLLVRRASTLAFYGGAWVFPGGRIDAEDGDLDNALELAALRAAARELREEAGLTVDESALAYFARWLTPPGRTRRFDTFYYAAIAPEGEVKVDRGEVDAHRWMQPIAALEAHSRGEIELPPPTFVTLTTLVPYARASEAHARLPIERQHYTPRPCSTDGGTIYLYPGDAGYEMRDPSLAGPRHRLTALASPWRYERD